MVTTPNASLLAPNSHLRLLAARICQRPHSGDRVGQRVEPGEGMHALSPLIVTLLPFPSSLLPPIPLRPSLPSSLPFSSTLLLLLAPLLSPPLSPPAFSSSPPLSPSPLALLSSPLFPSRSENLTARVAYNPVGGPGQLAANVSLLTLVARNVRSLLDNPRSNQRERKTPLVVRELAGYKVDIAALSETRCSKESQLEEVVVGYTFLWSGRPKAERRDAGVAFAIRSDIVGQLPCLPQDTNND
ncbi:hypothetical protein SprV_0401627700 [Sparganum proliferum]